MCRLKLYFFVFFRVNMVDIVTWRGRIGCFVQRVKKFKIDNEVHMSHANSHAKSSVALIYLLILVVIQFFNCKL